MFVSESKSFGELAAEERPTQSNRQTSEPEFALIWTDSQEASPQKETHVKGADALKAFEDKCAAGKPAVILTRNSEVLKTSGDALLIEALVNEARAAYSVASLKSKYV